MAKHTHKRRSGAKSKTKSEFFKLGKPYRPSSPRPSRGGTR